MELMPIGNRLAAGGEGMNLSSSVSQEEKMYATMSSAAQQEKMYTPVSAEAQKEQGYASMPAEAQVSSTQISQNENMPEEDPAAVTAEELEALLKEFLT